MSKSNIVLIGFMCAGKTTIGRLLSDALAKDFVDTDDIVEKEAGEFATAAAALRVQGPGPEAVARRSRIEGAMSADGASPG